MGMGMGGGGMGMGGKGCGNGVAGSGLLLQVDSEGRAIPRDSGGCGKDDKGKGKGKKPKRAANEPVEGARMQGILKTLSTESGTMVCPQMATEVWFSVEDLPVALQARVLAAATPAEALPEGQAMLFTLTFQADGACLGKEVMPIPGHEDVLTGIVKTYSTSSGYGFIGPTEDMTFTHDVYFNHKDLDNMQMGADLLKMQLRGVVLSFKMRLTADGRPQARGVELQSLPDNVEGEGPGSEAAEATGRTLRGQITTFKQSAGYGFLTVPALGRDVWFPRLELPAQLVRDDLPGTNVEFDLFMTLDQKPQARNLRLPGAAARAALPAPPTSAGPQKRAFEGDGFSEYGGGKQPKGTAAAGQFLA